MLKNGVDVGIFGGGILEGIVRGGSVKSADLLGYLKRRRLIVKYLSILNCYC